MGVKRQIVPRLILDRGQQVWVVRIPHDLRAPNDPQRRFFGSDKVAAKAFARQLTESRGAVAQEFLKLPPAEQSVLLNLLREFSVADLVAAMKGFQARRAGAAVELRVVLNECLAAKAKAGLRRHYLAQLRCSCGSFVAAMTVAGKAAADDVAVADVAGWLNGNGWAAKTRSGYLKDVQTFYKFAVKNGYAMTNPAAAVELPKVDYKGKSILAAADWARILRVVQEHDAGLVGWLCPILFGGLRAAESRRATAENFKGGVIDLDAGGQTKLNVRRAVKVSPQLRAWLKVDGVALGGGVNFKRRWERLWRRPELAGIQWSKNCHRHSFCSYALEQWGAPTTARAANHSEVTLFQHYANKVSRAEAKAFFRLRPF